MQTSAPYRMPITETTSMMVTILCRAAGSCGNSGSEKRMNPYVPIFNKTPARMTEPAVGASVCASGSQVWNGNIGTLIANAKKNAQNRSTCAAGVELRGLGQQRGNVKCGRRPP